MSSPTILNPTEIAHQEEDITNPKQGFRPIILLVPEVLYQEDIEEERESPLLYAQEILIKKGLIPILPSYTDLCKMYPSEEEVLIALRSLVRAYHTSYRPREYKDEFEKMVIKEFHKMIVYELDEIPDLLDAIDQQLFGVVDEFRKRMIAQLSLTDLAATRIKYYKLIEKVEKEND